MKLISLQSLIPFFFLSISLMMVDRELTASNRSTVQSWRYFHTQRSAPLFQLGTPTSILEAQLHFYMQPTAQKVNQRDKSYPY